MATAMRTRTDTNRALVDDVVMRRQLGRLARAWPDAVIELDHRNAYELLVATILAAQCTDRLINEVTPAVFAAYPDPAALAVADVEQLQSLVGRVTFFRQKSRHLVAMAQQVIDLHGGEIPAAMEALVGLPGVARKTANVVLGTAFGVAAGIVVDTHVQRLSHRLGWVAVQGPEKIERALMERLPKRRWITFSRQLILHGRRICKAKAPQCDGCVLAPDCPSAALA